MSRILDPLRDVQLEEPTAYCARCGGEIYSRWSDTARVDGEPVCRDCISEARFREKLEAEGWYEEAEADE